LCVIYGKYKYPIELKLRYGDHTYAEGLVQTAKYLDTLGCHEGWLLVFDRRTSISWADKIFVRTESFENKKITIIGC
ncbi:MAG: hypothetical protein LBQ66_14265, partial [Planctomycetaceae bacterium]|nr:hypothetical protein [Planctomycetaceae bacterium]